MSTTKLGAHDSDTPDLASGAAGQARQTIERHLNDLLASKRFGPGARLPTERALSEQFGVPRSAIRNAFSRLEAIGKVVRMAGSGTYVAEAGPCPLPKDAEQRISLESSPLEIMEMRILIEPRVAPLVISRATKSDLDFLQECLDQGEAADSLEGFEEWDTRLHQAIAEASHNRLFINIYGMITAAREQLEWGELKRRSLNPQRRVVLEQQHRDIVGALRARDAERAEIAMREHLHVVQRNLLG